MRMGPDRKGNTTLLIMLETEKRSQMIHEHISLEQLCASWSYLGVLQFGGLIFPSSSYFSLIWLGGKKQNTC